MVTIGGVEHLASEASPVVFGRADAPGVVGLDARDMGISAIAGAIEWRGLLWLVVNRSRKRKLYVDDDAVGARRPLDCGQCYAINVISVRVEVRGEIRSHGIDVVVPEVDLPDFPGIDVTDTVLPGIHLTTRDRAVVVALFEGYLLTRPKPWPCTYEQAAQRLGPPWTDVSVRKQVERLRIRLARTGPALEGPRALYDLAEYLLSNSVIGADDLGRDHP